MVSCNAGEADRDRAKSVSSWATSQEAKEKIESMLRASLATVKRLKKSRYVDPTSLKESVTL